MYQGIRIKPMNDFWIDCYSTAIFSILLSRCSIPQSYIYQNNYVYQYDRNERKKLGRVHINMGIEELVEHMLFHKEAYDFTEQEDIIGKLKEYVDQSKIILLGIDMFYGVPETSQWQKHHIRHYILVEGYDDETREVYVLETGDYGYKEYGLSYEDITLAAANFNQDSYIYDFNKDFQVQMYDMEQLKDNAARIIESIDSVLTHLNEIWHVDEDMLLSMRDEVNTHMQSMRNRQGVNQLLFEHAFVPGSVTSYINTCIQLKEAHNQLHTDFLHAFDDNEYYEKEAGIKERFRNLLLTERKLWKQFCDEVQEEQYLSLD